MKTADIREGATVRSKDGEKLGTIVACSTESFVIEKGIFFPKEYSARYADVIDSRDGDVILALSKDELRRRESDDIMGTGAGPGSGIVSSEIESRDLDTSAAGAWGTSEQTRIPVREEELEVEKRARESGEVRVTKDVVTEQKSVDVPVRRETVRVEQVPVSSAAPSDDTSAGAAFEEQHVSIPVRQEEVEIHKRPVVKEEVRVTKQAEEIEERHTDTVRKEQADIDTRGDVIETERRPGKDRPRPTGTPRPS